MKIKFIVLIVALFAIAALAAACGGANANVNAGDSGADSVQSAEAGGMPGQGETVDKTAELDGAYLFEDLSGKKIKEGNSFTDEAVNPDIDNISGLADVVVRGVATKVSFVGVEGLARTITSVLVTDVYKGELKKGDLISVYQLGGYIPLSEQIAYDGDKYYKGWSAADIADTVLKEVVNGENFPEKGEDCLYYLIHNKCPVYPARAFERIAGAAAKLKVITKAGAVSFERDLSESEGDNIPTETYSLEEVKRAIADNY